MKEQSLKEYLDEDLYFNTVVMDSISKTIQETFIHFYIWGTAEHIVKKGLPSPESKLL